MKIDPTGSVLWQRQIGAIGERAVDVDVDNQGNLIIVSNIGDEAVSRIRLFKIGQDGKTADSLKIEMGEKQVARSVMQASDNSYLIAGYAAPNKSRNPGLSTSPVDEADFIIIKVTETSQKFDINPAMFLNVGGGEHVGSAAKIFESAIPVGTTQYFLFGDSDRPYQGTYKRSFEAIGIDPFGSSTGIRQVVGVQSEIQICADAIRTYGPLSNGYLMIGTTFGSNNTSTDIYIAQFDITLHPTSIDLPLKLNRKFEGVSAAIAETDGFFILANEIQPNAKRDIVVLKMASGGAVLGSTSFGTLEGDDKAGAIAVLLGGRVALLGTLELETQKKMALMILSANGKFSD